MRTQPHTKVLARFKPSLPALCWSAVSRLGLATAAILAIARLGSLAWAGSALLAATVRWGAVTILATLCVEGLAIASRYAASTLDVYADRVEHVAGIGTRRTATAWIDQIIGLEFEQPLLGRLLGYGDVEIETTGSETIRMAALGDPEGLKEIVRQLRSVA